MKFDLSGRLRLRDFSDWKDRKQEEEVRARDAIVAWLSSSLSSSSVVGSEQQVRVEKFL